MAELTLSVDVQAPAAATWLAATDWARQGEWMPATTVRPVRGGNAVGAGIEAFTGIGRAGFLDTMEITAWDAPRECRVRHTGRVVRGTGRFAVEALAPDRSRFVWSEDLELPGGAAGVAGWAALGRPVSRIAVRIALRRFARWTEARARAGELSAA